MKWIFITLAFWLAMGALFFFIKPSYPFWCFLILMAVWVGAWLFVYRKTRQKIKFFIALILFVLSLYGLLNLPFVQNKLVSWATNTLSQKLHTKVDIKHISLSFFNRMTLDGVLVEDQHKDTLLYAGEAKVNITDWFFLKDQATLKYVGLKDARVNLNRTDSVWNYQFLIDFFSSPKKNAEKKKGLELDLKVLELENITFIKNDKWAGQDMTVSLKKLDLSADVINFDTKEISISTLQLNAPIFSQSNYTGRKPASLINLADQIQKIPVLNALRWNTEGWKVSIKDMEINNAIFINEKETERAAYTDRFDGQHLKFTDITGHLKNVQFFNDTLLTNLQLTAKEKSGLEIKHLNATVKFTPELMEFSDLYLETNKSKLQNYYAMRYKDFNEDLSSFMHNVILEGKFENSEINSDDLAIFSPNLRSWNRKFNIQGTVKGSIDNLSAKKILINSGNTLVDGDIALRGLPDIWNTFIDFKSNDLQTNYRDLITIVPALRYVQKPNLARLGNIRFRGNFTGFINDFVAFGNINTNLGNITADINMKLPQGKPTTYSGKISSGGFNLGQFLNSAQLGNIALDGKINGVGFNLKDLKAHFNGNIHQLFFSGYNYQNIAVNGDFEKQLFTGSGSVDDPNLKVNNFNGTIDLSEKERQFNFEADLRKADLKKLHLTNDDFNLAGKFNLDFKGNSIDDFLGTARVSNAVLLNNDKRLSFDSLTLRSFIVDGRKSLSLQSNEIDGSITGNFKIGELDDAFKLFLNRYYPAYIRKPDHVLSEQDFDFDIKTKNVDQYVQLFDKRLKGFDNATISGNLKLSTNELNVIADVPQFSYDGKTFTGIHLKSKGGIDSLLTNISVSDIEINDSMHLPGTQLNIASHKDISNISLKTSASKTVGDAELNASVQTLADGVIIHFFPSSVIINDKKWDLKKDGELTLRKSFIEAKDVTFSQGEQEIVISTEMDEELSHTNIIAQLRKVNINDFSSLFLKKPRLEGIATGTIKWKDPFGRSTIEYDIKADNFNFENNAIGTIDLNGDVNTTTGIITYHGKTDGKVYKFKVDGTYNYLTDSADKALDLAFLADRFDVSILNTYLGTVFNNLQGNATSDLKISNNHIVGSVTVNDGSFRVNYTQVKYKFNNETIIFNPDEIDIGSIQLSDTLGNMGTASGKMYHHMFQDFAFDNLNFKTGNGKETGRMMLLNTTKKDNSQFYGKVIGNATLNIDGPVTNMKMIINGEPSSIEADSNHIYIPTGTSKEISPVDYIDFVKFGTLMTDLSKSTTSTNISVDLKVTANPACKVDVILDEATGDVIKGQGSGQLTMHAGTNEPFTMSGRYDITQGEYKFNFQTWLKKFFKVSKGSIIWNNDPYAAILDVDAEYLAKNANLSAIDPSSTSQSSPSRGDLTIIAHLKGLLSAPKPTFEFKLDPNTTNLANNLISLKKLEDYRTDTSEMLKQTASLLLLNTFVTDESIFNSGNVSSLAVNSVGQLLSNVLTSTLTNILQRALNDNSITTYFDLSSSLDPRSAAAQLQGAAKFGITKRYFDGRLIISFGGNLDYNNPYLLSSRNSNLLLTPDFTAEWVLSKDGKIRIIGFRRTNVDLTQGQRNRQGISLTYRTEFDRLSELFAPSEEKKRKRIQKALEKENAGSN